MNFESRRASADEIDSAYSWIRLGLSLLLGTVAGIGLWSYIVVLPVIQADFGLTRADASLPYTLLTLGYAVGGVAMGRMADRFGITLPAIVGATALGLGYLAASYATSIWQLALVHGLLIGFGSSAAFAPLMADISHWFERRRGIAVGICAAGNYVAGAIWPLIVQYSVDRFGWRLTHVGLGVFCALTMLPLAMLLRRRPSAHPKSADAAFVSAAQSTLGVSPRTLQMLLVVAGITCCLAMSMPQVHIVAYCGDLGYGAATGAQMLSFMLAFGIVSRVGSGFIADRIGGVPTLLIGSMLQTVALLLYVAFDSLVSLFVISVLFGLFQGGIVPSYAIIVREYFSPKEAGTRVGIVVMATLFGMAFGGWTSGVVFDLTGSYRWAFALGAFWNLVNVMIAVWLLMRPGQSRLAPA
jgi:MFS family permease